MNPYSLRSKKSRPSSTKIIDLSLGSDDDDDSKQETARDKKTNLFRTTQNNESGCFAYKNHGAENNALLQGPTAKDSPHFAKMQNTEREKNMDMLPPEVTVSNNIVCASTFINDVCSLFDEADYTTLCQRYLTPRTRINPELPDGMVLRRQYRGRIIDANTPFYRKLRVQVDALLKKNNHEEVYRLLCQLRDWELDPRRVPAMFQSKRDNEDIVEVFDFTKSNDEPACVDCIDFDDDFIAETATKLSTHIPEVVPSSEHYVVGKGYFADEPNKNFGKKEAANVNAHSSTETHPSRVKLSKTTFHEWLAKKKRSWRRRRNKCRGEQKLAHLIWSPSSLRKALHCVKPRHHAERIPAIQSGKQTLLNLVKREKSCPNRTMPPATNCTRDYRMLAPDTNPTSPVALRGSSIVAVVTPDGKNSSQELFSMKQKNDVLQKRRRIVKRRLHAEEKITQSTQLFTPFCAFEIKSFGFPYSNKTSCNNKFLLSYDALNLVRNTAVSSRVNPGHICRTKRRRTLHSNRSTVHNFNFSIIPSSRIDAVLNNNAHKISTDSLHKDWNRQITKRKKGEWVPSGHVTGRWKPPVWANEVTKERESNVGVDSIGNLKQKKSTACRIALLPILDRIMENYAVDTLVRPTGSFHSTSLQDVICPRYVKPTIDLLRNAHGAVKSFLPDGDCEEWEVIKLARSYYNYWRPKETKVILLAESHAFTSKVEYFYFVCILVLDDFMLMFGVVTYGKDRAMCGPGLDLLQDTYFGPRGFLSLVYCLSYGENESLDTKMNGKDNKGTPQFWTLLAACARGVDYVACTQKPSSSPFASDLLKVGNLSVEERLRAKLAVLENLRRRGIWLIDTSIFGWYISQPQTYSRSRITNEVHRKKKSRPPSELKTPSLVLSWELFTKHIVREVADEGHLKYLIPIGMEVEAAVTRKRMEDAIRSSNSEEAQVSDTFPAPNAWIPGGYGPFHAKLAALVNKAAPRVA